MAMYSPMFHGAFSQPASAYDAMSWITGTPTYADDFASLALDAGLDGRTLPTGGEVWEANWPWVGAGNGEIKNTAPGSGGTARIVTASNYTDMKIRVIWSPGSAISDTLYLFLRDNNGSDWPYNGYMIVFNPDITIWEMDSWSGTTIAGPTSVTYLSGWNAIEIRAVGSTISGYVNGNQVISVSDATHANGNRCGLSLANNGSNETRISYVDFTEL